MFLHENRAIIFGFCAFPRGKKDGSIKGKLY